MPELRSSRTDAELWDSGLKECPLCFICFSLNGFERHHRACKSTRDRSTEAARATRHLQEGFPENFWTLRGGLAGVSSPVQPSPVAHVAREKPNPPDRNLLNAESVPGPSSSESDKHAPGDVGGWGNGEGSLDPAMDVSYEGISGQSPRSPTESVIEEGRIRIVHPQLSKRLYEREVLLGAEHDKLPPAPVFTGCPWAPFRTRDDFEFAKLVLNRPASEVNKHLEFHRRAEKSPITFKNYAEMREFEDRAYLMRAPFKPVTFSVPFQNSDGKECDLEFTAMVKPMFDWLLELVLDESIQQHLQFDAEQKFRLNSNGMWDRVLDEPWTTDYWDEIQQSLPLDGLPLFIELYADKTPVSSFGTKQMYPVVARLLNLPRSIRNGTGVAGGRIIALIPVVEGNAVESGKTSFANLKCAVWHKSLSFLLESIQSVSQTGHAVKLTLADQLGLDGQVWRLFPTVTILSGDYEEQTVMGTHRGLKAKAPCLRCLTPDDELYDLLVELESRDPEEAIELIHQALSMNSTRAAQILQPRSYRPVDNIFLNLGPRTNPFRALSYDTLHNDDLGRWGGHIWPLLKDLVKEEAKTVVSEFESRINAVPPWPDLSHFSKSLSVGFTDGGTFQDLLKVVLHGALALDSSFVPLVALIRKQAELRLIASLEVHTIETIELGRELIRQFDALSKECTSSFGKSFNFPKMHLLVHLFDDIWDKGTTAGYSTKPSESLHRTLHKAYAVVSKKRSTVDSEVARKSHLQAVYDFIEAQVELFDSFGKEQETKGSSDRKLSHITLGSKPRQFYSLESLNETEPDGIWSTNLRQSIQDCLEDIHEGFHSSHPVMVRECARLEVQYESLVDWCSHRDLLRSKELFHGRERHDCVLIDSNEGVAIARLLLMLECQLPEASNTIIPLVLVSFFDPVYGSILPMERAMGFQRFRERNKSEALVIPARSIIRGALMVSVLDERRPYDYLANDVFDPDMYLRFRMYTNENQFVA